MSAAHGRVRPIERREVYADRNLGVSPLPGHAAVRLDRAEGCCRGRDRAPAALEYVVVHEILHLREPNHSKAFWLEQGDGPDAMNSNIDGGTCIATSSDKPQFVR